MIEKVPVPICGVALGIMGVANIVRLWNQPAAWIPCILSVFLLALYVCRCIRVRGSFSKDIGSPVTACVFGTFPMTVLFLTLHISSVQSLAQAVFVVGTAIQLALMVWIAVRILPGITLDKVHASLFVPYVGIAAMGASGSAVGMTGVGMFGACLGLVLAVPILIVVLCRYVRLPEMPDPERPMFCILAAPFALCAVGFNGSFPDAPETLRIAMYAVALVLYILVMTRFLGLLRMPFVPGKASMGFPMTVSAVATYVTAGLFDGVVHDILLVVFAVQAFIAVAVVLYLLFGYARFLSGRTARDRTRC